MNPASQFPSPADVAGIASSVAELLEVLWGGGRDLAATPVSVSQLRVLFVLAGSDGINLRTLTESLDSKPSSVSRLCDRLEAVGLLQRTASAVSRRELELHLTPAGLALVTDMRAAREESLGKVLAVMSAADRRALSAGLKGFRAASAELAADRTAVPHVRTA
ncbi:MarR family transcriptional regulator [Kitasatospora sp. NBC_01560]|uniref:MarR family winged helix-turn-helix transcriptional regulator n=1 Tax=Kitasatospora sp. NBC_01560 TaxID=2975965 RepID=UPI00386E2C34